MTKLLAMLAIAVGFSAANANTNLPEPMKGLTATVQYTAAVPVSVTQAAWNRINENSRNANLVRLIAEDTSQCIGAAHQPGEVPACTLDMGGAFVTAIWSTAGYFIADAAEIAVNFTGDVLGAWSRAFNSCYEATKASLALPVGLACKIISFALDATGTIVRVVGNVVVGVTGAVVGGVATVIGGVFALPAALLRGSIEGAFKALFTVTRTLVTCVVPVIPLVLAIVDRKQLRALCGGN